MSLLKKLLQAFNSFTFAGGKLETTATLSGDIEIGAVELKDGESDTRASIKTLSTITSADNGLPVADPIVAGALAGKISVVSPVSNPQSSFVREAAAAQYAVNDVISSNTSAPILQSFANATRIAGGSGTILSARAFLDQATLPTGWGTLRMHLYHDAVTQPNDNDPFAMLFANRVKRVGFIDFSGWQSGGSGSDATGSLITGINLPFVTTGTSLYYILETRSALTSNFAQNANLWFELQILQN